MLLHGQPLTPCSRYPLGRKLVNLYDFISSIHKDFFALCVPAEHVLVRLGRLTTAVVVVVILQRRYTVLVIIARLNSQSVYYMREPG